LRKKKTQQIIKAKRKKIADWNQAQLDKAVNPLNFQTYKGYRAWAKDKYQMKDQILASMMSEDQFSHLHVQSDRGNQTEVFNFLLSILNGQEST